MLSTGKLAPYRRAMGVRKLTILPEDRDSDINSLFVDRPFPLKLTADSEYYFVTLD